MSLADDVPREWASSLRPFLQRADEFQQRVPVVAYFLRTHAAYLSMRVWNKEEGSGKAFILKLFKVLESEKKELQHQLDEVDGRVVLTQYALRLFSKADDEERSPGVVANMNLVRLFFTSSLLFEATAQFTEDGVLDPIAAEKRDYARYIAVQMKKALDRGVPYVSPNKPDGVAGLAPTASGASIGGSDESSGEGWAGMNFMQQLQQPGSGQWPTCGTPPQPAPCESAAPCPWEGPEASSTSHPQQQFHQQQQHQQQPQTTPTFQYGAQFSNNDASSSNSAAIRSSATAFTAPSIDAMIEAQNYAKQAVSALQFYDHEVARKMLRAALGLLEQR